jgi:putative endonuclease
MYFTTFSEVGIAIEFEKRIKKWSRKKKEALIASEYDKLPNLSKKKF